jgi:hypothetical protein
MFAYERAHTAPRARKRVRVAKPLRDQLGRLPLSGSLDWTEHRADATVCTAGANVVIGDTNRIRVSGLRGTLAVGVTTAAPELAQYPHGADGRPGQCLEAGAIAKTARELTGRAVVVAGRARSRLGAGSAVAGRWRRAIAGAIERAATTIVQHPAAQARIVVARLLGTARAGDAGAIATELRRVVAARAPAHGAAARTAELFAVARPVATRVVATLGIGWAAVGAADGVTARAAAPGDRAGASATDAVTEHLAALADGHGGGRRGRSLGRKWGRWRHTGGGPPARSFTFTDAGHGRDRSRPEAEQPLDDRAPGRTQRHRSRQLIEARIVHS